MRQSPLPGRAAEALLIALAVAVVLPLITGCVERTVKITSTPPGARVFLNDQDVGTTPLKVSFLWYGDYDIMLRKEGYKTLKTNHRLHAPWFQFPPLDLVFETMVPGTIRDEQEIPMLTMQPIEKPTPEQLANRAAELRDRALFEAE